MPVCNTISVGIITSTIIVRHNQQSTRYVATRSKNAVTAWSLYSCGAFTARRDKPPAITARTTTDVESCCSQITLRAWRTMVRIALINFAAGTKRRPSRRWCACCCSQGRACSRVVPSGDGARVPSFTLSAQRTTCMYTSLPSLFVIIS